MSEACAGDELYFDANASEPLRPEAHQAALEGLALTGNPSSVHSQGRQARQALDKARRQVAELFQRPEDACIFTSGATEANAAAIYGFRELARLEGRSDHVLVGATEHQAVRQAAPDADLVPVGPDGRHDLAALENLLVGENGSPPALLCVMAANNETGVVSDLPAIAALCVRCQVPLHVDAAQAAGRMKLPLAALENASLALSGHKAGGLAGAGALLLPAAMASSPFPPFMKGGGQEQGRRGGTPPLVAIMAMAAALEAASQQDWQKVRTLRQTMAKAMRRVGAIIQGPAQGGEGTMLPNTLSVTVPGLSAQAQLMALDLAGICVSSGSACSSGKVGSSPVLAAMGLGPAARQTLRISLPWNVQPKQVERFMEVWHAMVARHQSQQAPRCQP
ncbi:aminotransferase class V-fold PLP-dependent enzyme [Formicincola oecophyllae]|uniref:Cysteine desulfurase n=1 Tax=Formicincola oecophyllae TaxID=2558361 RepID=A0A4Y6U7X8_9PROT|nr:aminotransferase class V-fold PLP-dependent enzyme [Formicincola oecophyllae]QDH13452.1 aminotransferase class V-fold PLP-dependent enzyme [Formicincola oecophyllae]